MNPIYIRWYILIWINKEREESATDRKLSYLHRKPDVTTLVVASLFYAFVKRVSSPFADIKVIAHRSLFCITKSARRSFCYKPDILLRREPGVLQR